LLALLPPAALSGDLRVGGAAPDNFPADLLPPGSVINATAFSDRGPTVLATNVSLTSVGRANESARLASVGWTNDGPPVPLGFTNMPSNAPMSVCRDTSFAAIGFADRPGGGSYERVTIATDPRRVCVGRPSVGNYFADVAIPALSPPPNGRAVGGGGGGGGADELYSRSIIEAPSNAREVAAHYTSLMEAAGWKSDGSANDGDDLVVTRFAITSRVGDALTAVITVVAIKNTPRFDLIFSVVRNTPSRGRIGGSAPGIRGQ
jgi:hypothetical protein